MKSKVYFEKKLNYLYKSTYLSLKGFYPKDSKVLVKLHFGEPGNKTAFVPKDIEPVIRAMKDLGLKPILIDTPVAYNSPRGSVEGYEKVVREKGYDKLAKFIISDEGKSVKVKDFTAEVCKPLAEAENVLVLSHVKGHVCAGFGGAIKNLGMGGNTKKSKKLQHTLCKPKFVKDCQGCGTCARLCPFGAIEMVNGKAKIDLDVCSGCSICEINCSFGCLAPEVALFDDLLAQAASALINNFSEKTFYINIIKNVSVRCDCHTDGGEIISPDIGILFSENPVAIDKASIDLVKKSNNGEDVFEENNNKDPMLQVNYTTDYTDWKKDYELEEL